MGANGPLYTSLLTTNKPSGAEAGILYKVNDKLTIASVSSHSKAKPLDGITVGGYYKASFCDVKAKVTKDGVVSACVIKQVVSRFLSQSVELLQLLICRTSSMVLVLS